MEDEEMMKKWGLLLLLSIFLSACSKMNGEYEMSEKIHSIEQIVNEPNWEQIQSLGDELKQLHKQNEWKIQLLGDEDEYESLQESINNLLVAIEEKDLTETKLELSTIKTYLDDIYSL
ncbi:DUF4363 family protein [Lysinibacillus antri]|uniref:DUF4363 family protein n=2 Tax=Lysinibacillus antri TaxID=2498145 RepID=A0A3S0RU47_9BACI|nr:DUF4363 family protein [Lysinibacillus antri]